MNKNKFNWLKGYLFFYYVAGGFIAFAVPILGVINNDLIFGFTTGNFMVFLIVLISIPLIGFKMLYPDPDSWR